MDYKALQEQAVALLDDEDARTWMDADPSVAWDDPESLHGRLGQLLEDAGWERCHHRGTRWHYNVKLRGNASHRGYENAIGEYVERYDAEDAREIEEELSQWAERAHEWELENWWDEVGDIARVISESMDEPKVYSCGRSGGYLNIPQWGRSYHVPDMIMLAKHLQESVENFDSYEYGQWLAEDAIERRAEDKMEELASDKIERIEA